MGRPFVLIAMLGACLGQPPAAGAEAKRCAVIASPDCAKAGLGDLLTAKLSGIAGVELVERALIRQVLAEQELQLYCAADGGKPRRRLNGLLRADFLVLVRLVGEPTSQGLETLVAETRFGYRIARLVDQWKPEDLAAIAKGLGERVAKVLDRFAGGVALAVAMPPFTSGNLTHRFDHLQAAYARIAELEVLRRRGCAVVELEEARAIAAELSASEGKEKIERPQPFCILGEFRHEADKPDSPVSITLRLQRSSETVSEARLERIEPDLAATLVRKATVRFLAAVLKPEVREPAAPNASDEVQALTARAQALRATGEFEMALALHEAALLLDPGHHASREAILELCNRMLSLRKTGSLFVDSEGPEWKQRLVRARRGCEHLSALVRTRRFEALEDLRACVEQLRDPINRVMCAGGYHFFLRVGCEPEWRELRQAYRDFLLNDLPHTWRKEGWTELARAKDPLYYVGWNWTPLTQELGDPHHVHHLGQVPTRADFDFRLRLAREVLGDKPGAYYPLLFLIWSPSHLAEDMRGLGQGVLEGFEREYSRFLDQLLASEQPNLRVMARWARLRWRLSTRREEVTVADFEEMSKAIEEYQPQDPHDRSIFRSCVAADRFHFEHPDAAKSPVRLPARPSDAAPVRYEPVTIQCRSAGGIRRLPSLLGVVRCGKDLDALWRQSAVFLMRRRGEAEEVFADAAVWITDACWDGKWLWAGTKQGRLLRIDTAQRTVRSIGSTEGVPESGLGMVLCPVEPGKVCAVGAFPPRSRAWCAMVTEEGKVKVFHEAREVPKDGDDVGASVAFAPTWAIPIPSAADPRAPGTILVGRSLEVLYPGHNANNRLLAIDPAKLTVAPAAHPLPHYLRASKIRPNGIQACNQRLIWGIPYGDRLWAFDPANGATTYLNCHGRTFDQTGEVLEWDGKLFAPCGPEGWLEIAPDTLAVRLLASAGMPERLLDSRHFRSGRHAHFRSWHYGVLAWFTASWDPQAFYQVVLQLPSFEGRTPAAKQ